MKYDAHLSNLLDQVIYVMNDGSIIMQFKGNQHLIGRTGTSSMVDLRNSVEEYFECRNQ